MVLVVGVVVVFLLGSDGIDHPDEWDERVLPFVEFVEAERGLEFDHPVHVDFLTAEEYSDYMRVDGDDLTDEEREQLDEMVALLRALGLTSGSFDAVEATNELVDEGTLAVYSFDDRRIRVRGTTIDAQLEVTLVHELVHALQDQHFDLSRLSTFETSGEATAFRAIVEGDAMLVERRYVDSLPADARDQYYEEATTSDDVELDEVPEVLVAMFAAPYALGLPLVESVQAAEGWAGIDALLADPPTTEADLFDPSRLSNPPGEVEVEHPVPGFDATVTDSGDLGALTLYLMVAARLDPVEAMLAVDEWGADRYEVLIRADDDRLCVVLAVAPRPGGEGRLEAALRDWVDVAPSETEASLSVSSERIQVTSCDPGEELTIEPDLGSIDALTYPAMRSYLRGGFMSEGFPEALASCMALTVLTDLPLDLLTAPELSNEETERVQSLIFQAISDCRDS